MRSSPSSSPAFVLTFLGFAALFVSGCTLEMGSGRSKRAAYPAGQQSLIEQSMLACQAPTYDATTFTRIGGTPGKTNADVFAAARKKSKTMHFAIQENGLVTVEGASGAAAKELESRMVALSTVKRAAEQSNQLCHTLVLQRAMGIELDRLYAQNLTDPAREREASKKAIAMMKRFDAIQGATLGVMALYENAGRGGDPKSIDRAAKAASIDLAKVDTIVATDEDVEAFWKLAREKAEQLDAVSRTWGPEKGINSERDRRAMLGIQSRSSASPTTTTMASPLSSGLAGDIKLVSEGVLGLLHGDVGAVLKGAGAIFPKDSPVRAVFIGGGALVHGDIATALASAQTLAPKDSALAGVLATANQIVGAAKTVRT